MKRKSNHNQGFTLMEVLVSIAMVGVLFLPMLTFFSHSTQVNVKSKTLQRANAVAVSVMEEVEQIPEGVNLEDPSSYGYTKNGDIYTKIIYPIENDGKKFTAKVTIDPTEYQSFNSQGVPTITSLGSGSTVMAIESDNYTRSAIDYFALKYKNNTGNDKDKASIAKAMRKIIKVDLTDTVLDGDGDNVLGVDMANLHIYEEFSIDSSCSDNNLKNIGNYIPTDLYYGNIALSRLKGVYLFYKYDVAEQSGGNFVNIFQGIDVDVKISNPSNNSWSPDVKLYALCQKIYNAQTETDLAVDESSMNTYTAGHTECKTVITRTYQGTLVSDPNKMPVFSNFAYVLNTGAGSQNTIAGTSMNHLVDTSPIKERLSKVTVEVYEGDSHAEADKKVELTSTRGE